MKPFLLPLVTWTLLVFGAEAYHNDTTTITVPETSVDAKLAKLMDMNADLQHKLKEEDEKMNRLAAMFRTRDNIKEETSSKRSLPTITKADLDEVRDPEGTVKSKCPLEE